MYVFMWILVFVYFHQTRSGYIEIVQISGCESCRLMLTCRHLNSVIAILEVDLVRDVKETIGSSSVIHSPFPPTDPRDSLNQRCSGVNHCSFILTEDCPGCEKLGDGKVRIKFACITEDKIKKYCNSEIVLPGAFTTGVSEGFIHNPGYPRFYSGQKECRWKITAPSQQKIRLTVLDISLIVDNVVYPDDCTDVLEVRDTGQAIYSTCRQENPPAAIISGSHSLEVVLTSNDILNPRRGVLIHYTAVGCPTPSIPQDGYLVYRNNEFAMFSCCLGYHFPDTGTRSRNISCLGAYWNTVLPLPDCQNSWLPHRNQTHDYINKSRKAQNMSELLAPVLIIVALFLINGAVLFFIHKAKKKQSLENIKDEELGSFTSSPIEN